MAYHAWVDVIDLEMLPGDAITVSLVRTSDGKAWDPAAKAWADDPPGVLIPLAPLKASPLKTVWSARIEMPETAGVTAYYRHSRLGVVAGFPAIPTRPPKLLAATFAF